MTDTMQPTPAIPFPVMNTNTVADSRIAVRRRGAADVFSALEPVLKLGSAGDSPASIGDTPTGTAKSNLPKRRSPLARTVDPVPSGESPVLPTSDSTHTLTRGARTARAIQ